jgi:glyoxylase-like metal-dependent hydrolase (beta-lactamase superfamily II)
MDKARRARIAGLLLASALATNHLVFAQLDGGGPGRAPAPADIAQEWRLDNNERDTFGQAPLGDYTGIPFNEAGRVRSDTTPESIWGTLEYQCRPHASPHQWRGLGGARILKEQDPLTRDVSVYHIQFMRSLDRPIFMDRRPHPPAYAPHTWTGFSTGEWVGNTLKVTTTHLKDGFLRRGGPQTSDMYAMTEFITRHDDILTVITVIDDPIYLDQPYVHSTTYTVAQGETLTMETCNGSFTENGGTDRHWVPHFLPGQNTEALTEWLTKGDPRSEIGPEDWVPLAAARGGLKTLYPEYRTTLGGSVNVNTLAVPAMRSVVNPARTIADQSPRDGDVHVLPVQGNVYMLVADGTNITVSIGAEGVALVNTGSAQITDKVVAAVNQLTQTIVAPAAVNRCFGATCPGVWGWSSPYINSVISSPGPTRAIRYIVNTSAAPTHVGGNARLAAMGSGFRAGGLAGAVANAEGAPVVAHENVLNAMSAPAGKQAPTPQGAWPTVTYFDEFYKLPAYFNGEGVVVYHAPAANTDGDSIVVFRRSEVISAGDIFSTVSYPVIDVAKGGSVNGVIGGLNHILDLAFAEYRSQGGTWIVPSHGRLSDTADVASYRNMVVMIRDRVKDLMDKGMTLAQVKAARPSIDFDGRYGSTTGTWTTDMFIDAVYRSLQEKK